MKKDSKNNKSKKSNKKLHISDSKSRKMTKKEIDVLVAKNRVRNLTIGF